ncbi:hypothetical protein [Modicisalibacter xianhensis]|uniref:Uncharacterized protein n=1 Tax=Modicisalibacter xianhensis TaxID=442341 RepID=A0A1I2Y607_9GAMM|nr:hypothetical protein [Halomonas xianhensis]SFH19781.1 hypothetical protein SAMN04487959_101194 [Halomonas xianhensis]
MARAPWMTSIAVLTLALSLAACDGGEETPPEQTANEASQATNETSNGVERDARNTPAQSDTEMPQADDSSTDDTAQNAGTAETAGEVAASESSTTGANPDEAEASGQQSEEAGAGMATDEEVAPSVGERLADESWEETEDDVSEALKETERRFKEAEKELEEQFKAAEEQDVKRSQEIQIQPEGDGASSQ